MTFNPKKLAESYSILCEHGEGLLVALHNVKHQLNPTDFPSADSAAGDGPNARALEIKVNTPRLMADTQ